MTTQDREIFVVMPFGRKAFSIAGARVEVDFDRVYHELIRPAGIAAGWRVTRIDELPSPGVISEQYLKQLFEAPVVIADVSMPNGNVYYELGIRHAISTGLTLMIAFEGTELPFDIAHHRVLFYRLDELAGTRSALTRAVSTHADETANPVRTFLERLGTTTSPKVDNAAFSQDLASRIQRAKTVEQLVGIWGWLKNQSPLPALTLLQLAERLSDFSEWTTSVDVLRTAAELRPFDFEIHRTYGWHLRHLGPERLEEALKELGIALELNPHDPETLGMMGGLLKRRGDFARAAECYEDAARVAPTSLYIQVNLAAMLVISSPSQAGAGLAKYRSLLDHLETNIEFSSDPWSAVVAGEAAFALGQDARAVEHFRKARSLTRTGQELRSAADQLELFQKIGFRPEAADALARQIRDLPHVGEKTDPGAAPTAKSERLAPHTPVLLHLSDIHFGKKDGKDGQAVEMHRFLPGDYEKALHDHLVGEFCSKRAHFGLDRSRFFLIVSGDLTYRGTEDEFLRVLDFLQQCCDSLSLPKERVVLVPGNHDVHWPSAQIDKRRRFDNYLAFLNQFYGDPLFRKLYPLVSWNLQVSGQRPAPEDIVSIFHEDGISLVAMNSCIYETAQNHYGFVGGRQLENVEKLLDDVGGSQLDLRIAVLHHHLHPFPEPVEKTHENQEIWMDLSTIRDAGIVERRLEKLGFDLVLHGHKHKPQLRETLVHDQALAKGPVPHLFVCGAGSSGVNASELEHQVSNHYELIEVMRLPRTPGADFLTVEWREIALTPGAEWTTSKRWLLPG